MAQRGHAADSSTGSGGQGGLGPGLAGCAQGGEGSCGAAAPPPLPPGSYLPRAESRVLTVAEPLASPCAPAGPVLPRGTPAPARGPLGAGEAEAARGQSTRQAPRVSEVSGGCLGPERARESGGGWGLAAGDGSLAISPTRPLRKLGRERPEELFFCPLSFICPFSEFFLGGC